MKPAQKIDLRMASGFILVAVLATGLQACGPSGSRGASAPAPGGQVNPLALPPAAPPATNGDVIKISSIDGVYSSNHPMDVYVHPGDIVNLSADYFIAGSGFEAAQASVEAFIWSSTFGPQDLCDASLNQNCLKQTNFQLTQYGVAFYVPYTMPESVQIQVRGVDHNEVDAQGNKIYDTVMFHNLDFNAQAPAPALVTNPAEYQGSTLNPDTALVGMGNWVNVEGVRYFAPFTIVNASATEWTPYRNGYWAWENQAQQWNWISYDPWGWMTDHYGVWRHHGVYGWIWMPFEKLEYQPHGVTWFGEGEYIGWIPYHDLGAPAYRLHSEVEGFDDGFWLGLREGSQLAQFNGRFHPGFALINRRDVTSENINGLVINTSVNVTIFQNAFARNTFYPFPGGDRINARAFLEVGANRPGAITQIDIIHSRGGASFQQPRAVYQVPPESAAFMTQIFQHRRPVPIGSVIQNIGGSPRVLAPTTNGRSLVAPPMLHDGSGRPTGIVAIRTSHPVETQATNPIAANQRAPRAIPTVSTKQIPAFNPRQGSVAPLRPHSGMKTTTAPAVSEGPAQPSAPDRGQPERSRPGTSQSGTAQPAPTRKAPVAAPSQHAAPTRKPPLTAPSGPARDQPTPIHSQPAPGETTPAAERSPRNPIASNPVRRNDGVPRRASAPPSNNDQVTASDNARAKADDNARAKPVTVRPSSPQGEAGTNPGRCKPGNPRCETGQ